MVNKVLPIFSLAIYPFFDASLSKRWADYIGINYQFGDQEKIKQLSLGLHNFCLQLLPWLDFVNKDTLD